MSQESSTPEVAAQLPDWSGTSRYEVLGVLGKGGMGVVYEAFDRERRQLVALKTLLHFDAAALYLFKQEFRTLADVHHTNLVHLYELEVTEGGQGFFTMELLRGQDFRQYVTRLEGPRSRNSSADANARKGREERDTVRPGPRARAASKASIRARSPADLDRLRAALRQLVEGVHALHGAGKVHRDIKPSNVLVTNEGRVVLLDFGVATELVKRGAEPLGTSGEVVGTARYMAPETADDTPPSPASDWYSVGVMLYEALVGRPPFVGSMVDVLTMKALADPLPPSECSDGVPPELDTLCRSLLDRDPTRRPAGSEILRRLGVTRSSAPPLANVASPDPAAAFVGRQAQLDDLRKAFDVVRSGTPMTVRVGGAAGMGKSTLVNCFLDDLASTGEAVVLRGRVYEREAVPYKAVDSVVDALSRHLMHLAEADDALALPADAWALARVFPVLQRVPGIGSPPDGSSDDPQGLRRRAFGALRSLLTTLGLRQPLVVFIDDAQWGDVDSAGLLLELLRPPEAPALLLLMTYRDSEANSSPLLADLRENWPEGAAVRDIDVGALDDEDAMKLALALLDARDPLMQRTARAVARESRGSPFLIEELVRSNRGVMAATGATLAVLTLDQMVSQRLERLPGPARRLIEIVAVGGRPLPVSVLAEASSVPDSINELVTFLGAKRFARTGLREGRDVVEISNARIGETIVALLTPATLREHHGRLARVLEDAGGSDAEAIAMHWLGAGENDRAARFAERAAEHAVTKLAFDRAARLFRLTLESLPASSPEVPRLRVRLAEALQFAGRPAEAAHAYLAAVDGAAAAQRVEFRRAAAEQLISAGRIDEGAEMLHDVLAAAGMRGPRSPLSAVFWLVVYRFWLRCLGLRFKERTLAEVAPDRRLRVDALFTAAAGFAVVDVIVGACMQARHVIEALRVGDRFQVMRALAMEAAQSASVGGPQGKREIALVETASSLADREGTVEAHTYFDGAWGIGLFQRGRWVEAQSFLERGLRQPLFGNAGLTSVRLFAVYTRAFLGDMKETARRAQRMIMDAEDRGDRYTTVNLRTSLGIQTALAFDDPEAARRESALGLSQWTQTGFHVQHWQAMIYDADTELYVGNAGRAYERFMRDMPALKRSFLLHAGFVRAMTFCARARCAISSIEAQPEFRRRRIAEARSMARRLALQGNAWTVALSFMVIAMAENAAGNRPGAIAALREAAHRFDATGTAVYGSLVRYRLGQACGGEEGKAFVASALVTMAAQGIRNPPRWAGVHVPGSWGVPGGDTG